MSSSRFALSGVVEPIQSTEVVSSGLFISSAYASINCSNNNIYYIRSNILYRKPYVADGSGVAVSLINLTEVLPGALILDHDPNLSGVIYIRSGNLIYRYDTNG